MIVHIAKLWMEKFSVLVHCYRTVLVFNCALVPKLATVCLAVVAGETETDNARHISWEVLLATEVVKCQMVYAMRHFNALFHASCH